MSKQPKPYRVQIFEGRSPKRFSLGRYPSFDQVWDSDKSFHWEALLSEAAAQKYAKLAREDGYSVKVIDRKTERSGSYRAKFIAANPGPWHCVYCHKKLHNKSKLVVDHLVPVKGKRGVIEREALRSLGVDSINDVANLVPSCQKCNSHKANKGGIWVIRGLLGRSCAWWVLLRLAQLLLALLVAVAVCWVAMRAGAVLL